MVTHVAHTETETESIEIYPPGILIIGFQNHVNGNLFYMHKSCPLADKYM